MIALFYCPSERPRLIWKKTIKDDLKRLERTHKKQKKERRKRVDYTFDVLEDSRLEMLRRRTSHSQEKT